MSHEHGSRDFRRDVHNQALKGAFSPSQGKKWAHELSGSVVSLMGGIPQIETHAHARIAEIRKKYIARGQTIPSKIQFAGVASATTGELRATVPDRALTDVIYTPLEHPAHADVVTYQTTTETLDPVRHWLTRILRVTSATSFRFETRAMNERAPERYRGEPNFKPAPQPSWPACARP